MRYYIDLIDTKGNLLLTSDAEFFEADSAERALDMFRDKLNQIIAEHRVPDDEDNYITYSRMITARTCELADTERCQTTVTTTYDGSSQVTFMFNPDDEALVLGFEEE